MWVARDWEGIIDLFTEKPKFYEYHWYADNGEKFRLPDDFFPNLTLEDGPLEVCLVPQKDVDNFIEDEEKEHEDFIEYIKTLREP